MLSSFRTVARLSDGPTTASSHRNRNHPVASVWPLL